MNIPQITTDFKDKDGDIDFDALKSAFIDQFDSPIDFVNQLSIATAKAYVKKLVSYTDADLIMNDVFNYIITDEYQDVANGEWSSPAYEIYDAFDAGEYHHRDDDRSVDPVEKYTDPAIRHILNSLS